MRLPQGFQNERTLQSAVKIYTDWIKASRDFVVSADDLTNGATLFFARETLKTIEAAAYVDRALQIDEGTLKTINTVLETSVAATQVLGLDPETGLEFAERVFFQNPSWFYTDDLDVPLEKTPDGLGKNGRSLFYFSDRLTERLYALHLFGDPNEAKADLSDIGNKTRAFLGGIENTLATRRDRLARTAPQRLRAALSVG